MGLTGGDTSTRANACGANRDNQADADLTYDS